MAGDSNLTTTFVVIYSYLNIFSIELSFIILEIKRQNGFLIIQAKSHSNITSKKKLKKASGKSNQRISISNMFSAYFLKDNSTIFSSVKTRSQINLPQF